MSIQFGTIGGPDGTPVVFDPSTLAASFPAWMEQRMVKLLVPYWPAAVNTPTSRQAFSVSTPFCVEAHTVLSLSLAELVALSALNAAVGA